MNQVAGQTTAGQTRILLLGDARQVHLARWAEYLNSTGYKVLTASLEPDLQVPGSRHRIHLPDFLPAFLRYPLAVPAVRRLIKDFEPHLINAHFLPNYGVITSLIGFSPWVLSTWGSDIMILPLKSAFHRLRTRWVIRSATFITSDAEVMTTRLVELGAAPDRVVTFPYGVDRSLFYAATGGTEREAPGIISNRKLESVYDIPTILSAFEALREHLPRARLTVAGAGSKAKALRGQISKHPNPESVRFVGTVTHREMPGLLREHDLYVSMAVSDTTSVSLLEAMACGLLPIVSDIPANREWIEHERNGLLVPVGDARALERALGDAWKDRGLRGTAARVNAALVKERADWFENMSAVRTLFDRLVSGGDVVDAA